jgi:hypothetical protein
MTGRTFSKINSASQMDTDITGDNFSRLTLLALFLISTHQVIVSTLKFQIFLQRGKQLPNGTVYSTNFRTLISSGRSGLSNGQGNFTPLNNLKRNCPRNYPKQHRGTTKTPADMVAGRMAHTSKPLEDSVLKKLTVAGGLLTRKDISFFLQARVLLARKQ